MADEPGSRDCRAAANLKQARHQAFDKRAHPPLQLGNPLRNEAQISKKITDLVNELEVRMAISVLLAERVLY
jgi:hypothetical protein